MIDIKIIRENPKKFKDAAAAKNFDVDIDTLLQVDKTLKDNKQQLQDIATEKNKIGKSLSCLDGPEKQTKLNRLTELKQFEIQLNATIKEKQPEFDTLMLHVPQPPDDDVPTGTDDTENVELRKWGKIRKFDFEPKDHVQLGLDLDIIDIPRGVKLAGTRNYFLKGDGALLHRAVLQFAMDSMIDKGYLPLMVPLMMKDQAMQSTGFYPGSEEQTYRMEKDALNLAGTAEVPMTAYHSGEILDAARLPLRYVAMSTCFRREAGAAGKDTHGLYRIHQFDKVEQIIIGENDEQKSKQYHAEILQNAEAVM